MCKLTSRTVVVVLVMAVGFAAYVSADHSWGSYHWARTSNPFTLRVVDSVTSAWDSYLDTAIGTAFDSPTIADWSDSSVLNLTKETGRTGATDRWLCSSVNRKIRVCNYPYGNTGWLGIARIWIDGASHITKAITALNDTYFNTATYNTPPWRRLVMCQEIGHDFGLNHQDEAFDNVNLGSCMDYTSDPLSNQYPNAHDYEQLELIYAHMDGNSTVSGSGAANSGAAAGAPPQGEQQPDFIGPPGSWGRLVQSIAGGRVRIYELDLGGGHRVLTRVIRADPAADAQ